MKIFFDENFSKYLAAGISELQKGVKHESIEVYHIAEYFKKGIKDEEWIPKVAKMHAVVVTQDTKIARTTSLWQLCKDYKLGIFFVKPPKTYKYWDLVQFMIKKWNVIKESSKNSTNPYAFRVTPRSIEKLRM
jgi:hypothetical protein